MYGNLHLPHMGLPWQALFQRKCLKTQATSVSVCCSDNISTKAVSSGSYLFVPSRYTPDTAGPRAWHPIDDRKSTGTRLLLFKEHLLLAAALFKQSHNLFCCLFPSIPLNQTFGNMFTFNLWWKSRGRHRHTRRAGCHRFKHRQAKRLFIRHTRYRLTCGFGCPQSGGLHIW